MVAGGVLVGQVAGTGPRYGAPAPRTTACGRASGRCMLVPPAVARYRIRALGCAVTEEVACAMLVVSTRAAPPTGTQARLRRRAVGAKKLGASSQCPPDQPYLSATATSQV